jgi:signal transduction histidine kinase
MTDYYKFILDNLNCNVIIWELIDNKFIIKYSNLENLININLDHYVLTYNITYKNIYYDILKTKINYFNNNIIIKYVNDNILCEYKYVNNNYLLCAVSNKLKDPLTNLVGAVSVINYGEDDKEDLKENIKYLELVRDSTMNIVTMANDIIDIVNLENSKIVLNKQELYIESLIISLYKTVSTKIKQKKLNFTYKIADPVPKIIIADEERLLQLLINLLDNAINNTQFGAINVEINKINSIIHKETNCPYIFDNYDKYILFKIKDTGAGIDSENIILINNILNINKVNILNIANNKNYGFGLTICKDLVNLMGGYIWFKTEVDIGSVFYVCIC